MKIYIPLLIISFLIVTKSYSQSTHLDMLRMESMVKKDTLLLKQILHDSLVYIHSNGLIESKNDFIFSIISGKIEYNDFQILERKLRSSSKLTRSYSGLVRVIGKYKGDPFQVKLAFVSCYRKRGKTLKLIYWQSTKMTD